MCHCIEYESFLTAQFTWVLSFCRHHAEAGCLGRYYVRETHLKWRATQPIAEHAAQTVDQSGYANS